MRDKINWYGLFVILFNVKMCCNIYEEYLMTCCQLIEYFTILQYDLKINLFYLFIFGCVEKKSCAETEMGLKTRKWCIWKHYLIAHWKSSMLKDCSELCTYLRCLYCRWLCFKVKEVKYNRFHGRRRNNIDHIETRLKWRMFVLWCKQIYNYESIISGQ